MLQDSHDIRKITNSIRLFGSLIHHWESNLRREMFLAVCIILQLVAISESRSNVFPGLLSLLQSRTKPLVGGTGGLLTGPGGVFGFGSKGDGHDDSQSTFENIFASAMNTGRSNGEDEILGESEEVNRSTFTDIFPEIADRGVKSNKGNALDFLILMESIQSLLDHMGRNEECGSILLTMNHAVYTIKELISAANAINEMGNLWHSLKPHLIGKCFLTSELMPSYPTFDKPRPLSSVLDKDQSF